MQLIMSGYTKAKKKQNKITRVSALTSFIHVRSPHYVQYITLCSPTIRGMHIHTEVKFTTLHIYEGNPRAVYTSYLMPCSAMNDSQVPFLHGLTAQTINQLNVRSHRSVYTSEASKRSLSSALVLIVNALSRIFAATQTSTQTSRFVYS